MKRFAGKCLLGDTKLVSLAELMREYAIGDLASILAALNVYLRDLSHYDQLTGVEIISASPSDEQVLAKKIESLDASLELLLECCNSFEADSSLLNQIIGFIQDIRTDRIDRRPLAIYTRLRSVVDGVEYSLGKRKFMYVPADQAAYWNTFFCLGNEFLLVFPHPAKVELQELGNCFAAGRWTACVFHSMRLAEHGLRKLAKSLGVKIKDKHKSCPIEFGDWNKVIDGIKVKIGKAKALAAGPAKSAKLTFYSEVADHCEYMKDIWRNEMAHTRKIYNKPEALNAMNRSKGFIEILAKHYAEIEVKKTRKSKTP